MATAPPPPKILGFYSNLESSNIHTCNFFRALDFQKVPWESQIPMVPGSRVSTIAGAHLPKREKEGRNKGAFCCSCYFHHSNSRGDIGKRNHRNQVMTVMMVA